jgi:uncharacterized membrane protein YdfJ with MMPL/SSD domain
VLRRPWLLYLAWFAVCAVLFVALDGLEDPSRPRGRMLSVEAARVASRIAEQRGLRNYEVVHVARARAGEGAPEDRWVILLDQVPHTSLERAVVIELDIERGTFLRMRPPVR